MLFSTEPERETTGEREHRHKTREENADQFRRDLQLNQRGHEGEDENRPFRHTRKKFR